jgi:hypothetical protein
MDSLFYLTYTINQMVYQVYMHFIYTAYKMSAINLVHEIMAR